jgi:NF-X1-type zinc finger protein NFXL1
LISIKVNVRCACNTLKKEWVCKDVLKEYRRSGRDPKEVPKGQFGVGLLACGDDCAKKIKDSAAELHLRKVQEIKVPDPTIITEFPYRCTGFTCEGFTTKELDFEVTY